MIDDTLITGFAASVSVHRSMRVLEKPRRPKGDPVDEKAIINEVLSRQVCSPKSKNVNIVGCGCGSGCKDWETSKMLFKGGK